MDEQIIKEVYEQVSAIAFVPATVYTHHKAKQTGSAVKNVNSLFYKTLRGAFNCISNLLTQEES